jgi:hypothetical protein
MRPHHAFTQNSRRERCSFVLEICILPEQLHCLKTADLCTAKAGVMRGFVNRLSSLRQIIQALRLESFFHAAMPVDHRVHKFVAGLSHLNPAHRLP